MRTLLDTLVLAAFIACGIARLARYNATVALMPKDSTGNIKYFEGTPIPTTLVILAVIAYNVHKGYVGDQLVLGELRLYGGIAFHPFVLLFALSGVAMVSKTLKIPKI
jgi:CDP-diacylglycerol--serine O-phosphatidyltransferase